MGKKKNVSSETRRLKQQIAELQEDIRQLKETVGMLVSIMMDELEEEETPVRRVDDDEFMFYN